MWDCLGWDWLLKFCLCCRGPPNGKVFGAPFLITPPSSLSLTVSVFLLLIPSITVPAHRHTHTLGVGMICRFRCIATLLPILASFRHRQHFLPLSSTLGSWGREREGGERKGGHRGRIQRRFLVHNLIFSK